MGRCHIKAFKGWPEGGFQILRISDGFGWFRTVSDGFGSFRIVFGPFSDRFRIVFGSFSDRFRTVSDRFRTVNDDSIPNFKISNFNWPGLGHRRGRPPFRPVGADRRSEAGPSPGQLKFEILRKIDKKTKKNETKTKTGF